MLINLRPPLGARVCEMMCVCVCVFRIKQKRSPLASTRCGTLWQG